MLTEYEDSMKPKYSLAGSRIGAPTSPMSAKQLEETGKRLNEGVTNVEVGALSPETFETIPREHFEAIRQLSKITGSNISIHAPMIDPAGFPSGEGQKRWSEESRKSAEQHIISVVERAHMLGKNGNVPVVLHASQTPSQEYDKNVTEEKIEKGRITEVPYKRGVRMMTAINQDSGEIVPLEWERKVSFQRGGGEKIWTPDERLKSLNRTQWDKIKLDILSKQKEINELNRLIGEKARQNEILAKRGLQENKNYQEMFQRNQRDVDVMSSHISNFAAEVNSEIEEAYNKFTKFADAETRRKGEDMIKKARKEEGEYLKSLNLSMSRLEDEMKRAKNDGKKMALQNEINMQVSEAQMQLQKMHVNVISGLEEPKIFRPVSEFAVEKTAETVGNVMKEAYKKFGENAPVLALENFWPNTAMSRADELRRAVMEARKKFVEKALADGTIKDRDKAEKAAEKLIGATWDLGHINNLRKAGYSEKELKKILKEESARIGDVAKHVHVTDNFGFSDSHLPPGMGNVPIREMMEELEKKGFSGRAIMEAGGFVKEFGVSPQPEVLSYFESPLYTMGGPRWQDIARTQQSYMDSFVEFPQQHFSLYGSSFATVPKTLGGQAGSEKSRFSDTPTA